jgi:hypothetical protein
VPHELIDRSSVPPNGGLVVLNDPFTGSSSRSDNIAGDTPTSAGDFFELFFEALENASEIFDLPCECKILFAGL